MRIGKKNNMRRGDCVIRKASLEDAEGIATVHVRAWRTTYVGIFPQDYLDNLSIAQRTKRRQEILSEGGGINLVLEKAKEIIGFACGGPVRTKEDAAYSAEVYAIYLLKAHQGSGLGKWLMQALAKELRREGMDSLCVWVAKDNKACDFYAAMKGKADKEEQEAFADTEITIVRYGWDSMESL